MNHSRWLLTLGGFLRIRNYEILKDTRAKLS